MQVTLDFHSSCTPLPLNEWLESNHWYQWCYNGFWSGKPMVPMVLQWFLVWQPLVPIIFQWFCNPATIGLNGFSMVSNGS